MARIEELSCGEKAGGEGGKKRCQGAYGACGDSLGRSAELNAKGSLQHCIIYELQDQLLEHNHTFRLNTWTTNNRMQPLKINKN